MFSYLNHPSRSISTAVRDGCCFIYSSLRWVIRMTIWLLFVVFMYFAAGFMIASVYNLLAGGLGDGMFSILFYSPVPLIIVLAFWWVESRNSTSDVYLFRRPSFPYTTTLAATLAALSTYPVVMYWTSLLCRQVGLLEIADFCFRNRFLDMGIFGMLGAWFFLSTLSYLLVSHLRTKRNVWIQRT